MSHICRLPTPQVPLHAVGEPVMIRNQSLFDDFVRLAHMYQMAFPAVDMRLEINSYNSAVDAALTFFCMIEDEYFPLEHMWDWDDCYDNYEGTIRRWLRQIPVRVVGHDPSLNPRNMTEPKALLTRLSKVGNYSDTAKKHQKVLRYQYPEWGWDVLSEFSLSRVIETLDEMILPPPFDRLPALVRYITGESNTYFLDYTIEDWPHHIMWNEFNLGWLKQDWDSASKIMDQSDVLCHWLIKNPKELRKVWTVLKTAHQRRAA